MSYLEISKKDLDELINEFYGWYEFAGDNGNIQEAAGIERCHDRLVEFIVKHGG